MEQPRATTSALPPQYANRDPATARFSSPGLQGPPGGLPVGTGPSSASPAGSPALHDAHAASVQRQLAALQAQQSQQAQQQAHMQQLLRSLTPQQQQQIAMLPPHQQVCKEGMGRGGGLCNPQA